MSIENPNLFNVRIKNKYDTLDAWNSSKLVLEAGEIALAYTTTTGANSSGTLVTHPAILMKVGDGVHYFNEINPETSQPYLPWISAKAADVLSACKTTAGLTEFVTNVVNGLGIASDEAMQALTKRVGTAEGAIDALEALVGTEAVSKQITDALNGYATEVYADQAAKNAANAKDEAITAAKKAGDDAQDTIDAYIESNNAALAQVKATADAAAVKTEVDNAIAAVEATANAAAVKTEVEQALAGKADKQTTLAGYGITDAMTAEAIAQAIATAKGEAEKYADDHDTDTTYGIVYDSTSKEIKLVAGGTDDTIDARDFIKDGMISTVVLDENDDLVITFNTDAGKKDDIRVPLDKLIDVYVGKATDTVNVTVEGREISATVKAGSISESHLSESVNASLDKADSAVQAVTTGTDNGTIAVDGTDVKVKGLGSAAYKDEDYFDKANAAATAKSEVIGQSGDAANADTVYGAKKYADEKVATALAEAKKYADDNDANTTYGFKLENGNLVITPSEGNATTLDIATQGELNEALKEAKDYTDDEIAKLDSEVKVTEITDKSGYNVLTGVTQADGKLTSKTELKLSNLAVTASTDDLVQGTMTLVFDCGNSN